jgi:phage shock protein C
MHGASGGGSTMTGTGRLTRSRSDRVITGVCGGLARHLAIDPLWLRLAFVFLVLAGGSGVLLYIILSLVLPSEDAAEVEAREVMRMGAEELGERARDMVGGFRSGGRDSQVVAVLLIIIGLFFLVRGLEWFRWLDLGLVAPLFLIGLGAYLLTRQRAV